MVTSSSSNDNSERDITRQRGSSKWIGLFAMFLVISADGVNGFSIGDSFHAGTIQGKVNVISSSSSRRRRTTSCSTLKPLQYQNIDNADMSSGSSAVARPGWLGSVFRTKKVTEESDEHQAIVDDYLEFLDRRYHRVYDQYEENNEGIGFSALKWLTQPSNKKDAGDSFITKEQEEDALYVLGVAGLASQKLLQKHNSVLKEDKLKLDALNAEAVKEHKRRMTESAITVDVIKSTPEGPKIPTVIHPLVTVLRKMEASRRLFVRYQMRKTRGVMLFALKSVLSSPSFLMRRMLDLGGGKKVMMYTVTAFATLAIVLRPLLQTILSDRAMNA